jgi:hypothetical protein
MKRLIASAAALVALPGIAMAHEAPTTGTTASTPTTGDVSASTGGTAQGTQDGVGVTGTSDAAAANGGTAETQASATLNNNTARQTSSATATDEDETARSTTRSKASKKCADVSHSKSMYKQDGEKPVMTHEHDVTTPKEKAEAADPGRH